MKILVSGGAGFIGSHILDDLFSRGHELAVVDDLSSGLSDNIPPGIPLYREDIRCRASMKDIAQRERPEIAIHLAAQMNVRRSLQTPEVDAEINILGSLSFFQAVLGSGAHRIIYASSGGAVYGEPKGDPFREVDPARPLSPYGIAKLATEQYGEHLARNSGSEFIALRLANVYGPRQNPAGEAGVVSLFLQELLGGRSPRIFGDGAQTRDFVWVGDVACAFRKAIVGPPGVYNVGTGKETSVRELYLAIARILGCSLQPVFLPATAGEVRRSVLSTDRAREALGWQPEICLERGLLATCNFVKGQALPRGSQAITKVAR